MLTLHRIVILFCLLSLTHVNVKAQSLEENIQIDTPIATDTLKQTVLERNEKGLICIDKTWIPLNSNITLRDTMFYDPSFLPVVFDGNSLSRNFDFRSESNLPTQATYRLIPSAETLETLSVQLEHVRNRRNGYIMNINNIPNIKYTSSILEQLNPLSNEENLAKRNFFHNLISAEDATKITAPTITKVAPKAVHWLKRGEHSLQFTQNYISDNWYKGGNSNFMLRNYHKLTLEYKKDKINFKNTFEWKLALQNTSGDTIHDINVSDDLLRSFTELGYQAYNNWSYSSTLEMRTPLFNAYPENSSQKIAALFSPLDITAGIGMSYSTEKKFKNNKTKNIKFSTSLSPLSIDFRYVADNKVDETKLKLDKGEHSKTNFGSLINANLEYNFNSYITWNSRFKYFSNYKSTEIESENKLNMILNRYFSTTLGFYLRFDDGVGIENKKNNYIQTNELLSFGLNYKW